MNVNRRQFIEFMGRSSLALYGAPLFALSSTLTPLTPNRADELRLAPGFTSQILLKEGAPLNLKGERFGANNDYLALFPFSEGSTTDALLWVNHEDLTPLFASGYAYRGGKTKEMVDIERKAVGGSIVRIKKHNGAWSLVEQDTHNRRIDATTPIPLGDRMALGTLGNCAGGVTPWGTVLTCEENYGNFYGEVNERSKNPLNRIYGKIHHGWDYLYPEVSPYDYGWVVEIDPRTGTAKKLTALGRFSHEGATVVAAKDGRSVVYMGDDAEGQCIYKFIAAAKGSLDKGELFVADTVKGVWLSLSYEKEPRLRDAFKNQLDVLNHCRRAADIVGGTPQNRPEDIEQDPHSKALFITLTNNASRDDLFGSILKIEEENADPLAMRFKASTFLAGGKEHGFACPDNMVFDRRGNLWLTCDVSSNTIGKKAYEPFGNNGLHYIPMSGPNAGRPVLVATAPVEAELTGPCFSLDGTELFMSVQHPGEESKSLAEITSHWPDGGNAHPRSAVVVISGPMMANLVG